MNCETHLHPPPFPFDIDCWMFAFSLGSFDFSGKFVLRLEPAMHRWLAAKALAAGESLNNFCAKKLAQA